MNTSGQAALFKLGIQSNVLVNERYFVTTRVSGISINIQSRRLLSGDGVLVFWSWQSGAAAAVLCCSCVVGLAPC